VQSVNVIEGKKAEQRMKKAPRTLSSSLLKRRKRKEKDKETPSQKTKKNNMNYEKPQRVTITVPKSV